MSSVFYLTFVLKNNGSFYFFVIRAAIIVFFEQLNTSYFVVLYIIFVNSAQVITLQTIDFNYFSNVLSNRRVNAFIPDNPSVSLNGSDVSAS